MQFKYPFRLIHFVFFTFLYSSIASLKTQSKLYVAICIEFFVSSTLILSPTFPENKSTCSLIGSWPEIKTRF